MGSRERLIEGDLPGDPCITQMAVFYRPHGGVKEDILNSKKVVLQQKVKFLKFKRRIWLLLEEASL